MEQIFQTIPDEVKRNTELFFNLAIQCPLPIAAQMLNEYTSNCANKEEQEFVEFYFKMRMEQINGSNSNQR